MDALIRWFINNRVAANLLMLIILVAGMVSIPQIRKEFLPDHSLNTITVSVSYPGASPEDVEQSVIARIERAVSDLKGIQTIKSLAAEGVALIAIEVDYNESVRRLLEDVKARVDAITHFPAEAGRPVIAENDLRGGVSKIMIAGPAEEAVLRKIAVKLQRQLIDTDEISQVELSDAREPELQIVVDQFRLQRYGISMVELVQAIRGAASDLPGGSVLTEGGTVSIRTRAWAKEVSDVAGIVLRATPDGGRVRISDVAEVKRGFSGTTEVIFNGQPAVSLSVYRVGSENIVSIAKAIERELANPRFYVPPQITLSVWQDTARLVESRLNLLTANAFFGLLLVFLILLVFLRARLAFWVSFGIPVSFMGTLAVMPFLGISLNMISLFGFILVLGILVDDAIVVGESIYGEHSQGRYGTLGAQQGVLVVSKPVIFSTLTTLVAFLPLVFMSGLQGKLARDIPLVVMVALTVSLIESLLILPAHLADVSSPAQRKKGWSSRVYEQFTLGLEWVIERLYQPALEWVLRRGGWCLAIFVSLYLITAGLLSGGWLGMLDDINMESEYIAIQVDYPAGTPLDTIRNEMEQVQGAALRIEKRLEEQTGERYFVGIQITSGVKEIENQSNMIVGLTPNERRHFSTSTVLKHFQKEISALPLQGRVRFKTGYFAEEGKATLQLTGFDLPALKSAAELVKSKLASYAFVYDVTDDLQKGRAEVRLKLKPAARDLGLSETALALQVRQAFYGVMAQTLLLDNHETAIFIRLPREQRESLWDLENLPVMLPAGEYVPLVNVANVEYGAAPLYINRIDGKRVITISAMTEYRGNQPAVLVQTIVKTLRPLVNERFPEIQLEVAGQVKHQQEYKNYLLKSVVLSLLGMYILMAVLFKSYWQPFMVLVAVPFGQIGALLGHAVTGIDVSLWSFVGIVAVSGVVVNDNLVLIDCINRLRQQSYTLMDAIRQATRIRFRPIVLTSVTTFAGLTPLLLERSWQAQFLKPMAVSLAFGVMFATLMTLFLVPVLCVLFDQLLNRFKHRKNAILESLQAEEKGQIALDQAYEQGYSQGVIGQGAESPYQGDVLHAGWEAGWQDGHDVWLSRHPDSEEDGN